MPSRQTEIETLPLVGRQELLLARGEQGDTLQIVSEGGQVALTVVVTEDGPVLRLEGTGLRLQVDGDLDIEAGRLRLHGDRGLEISSNQDINLNTPQDLTSSARIQNLTATRGNVNVKANDDVTLRGERVLVNC